MRRLKFSNRIMLTSFLAILLGVALMVAASYNGIREFSHLTDSELYKNVGEVTMENLKIRLDQSSEIIYSKLDAYRNEQAILADIIQKIIDNEEAMVPFIDAMKASEYFVDKLQKHENWYQNDPSEPSALLVQKYNLNPDGTIREDVSRNIELSLIADLLYPSFYKYGTPKQWLYFTGGESRSYMRIYPWVDIGPAMDSVYPGHSVEENWEAFSPGLIGQWKAMIAEKPGLLDELDKLAIIKDPSIDGGTGNIVATMNLPVFDKSTKTVEGSVSIDVNISDMSDVVSEINLGKTGFAFLSDDNGEILAINDSGAATLGIVDENVDTGSGYKNQLRLLSSSTFKEVRRLKPIAEYENPVESTLNIDGKDYVLLRKNIYTFNSWSKDRGIYENHLTLSYIVPYSEVYFSYLTSKEMMGRKSADIFITQVLIGIITIASIMLIMKYMNELNIKDLKDLENAAQSIMNKDFGVDVKVRSDDEIGVLATAFKSMKEELNTAFVKLSEKNTLLENEISSRKAKEKYIMYLENYDFNTKLPKVNLLLQKMQEYISIHGMKEFYIVLIGVDNFRLINESYSREYGDMVLSRITDIMIETGGFDYIAKLEGNLFGLVSTQPSKIDEAALMVEKLQSSVSKAMKIKEEEFYVNSNAGIASYPKDASSPEELLMKAHSAYNSTKHSRKGSYSFYDENLNSIVSTRLEMASKLRRAIENEELFLVYQPIMDILHDQILGFETLVRWKTTEGRIVPPSEFIPLAEDNNLIDGIGIFVFDKAIAQLKAWEDMGYNDLKLSVNFSTIQFKNENLIGEIKRILEKHQVASSNVNIEITETSLMGDFDKVNGMLKSIKDLGLKISVDDFGTGYSSLNYIKRLLIDEIKIDRSFIIELDKPENAAIVNLIISLSKSLKYYIVAEGVETDQQKQFLIDNGCLQAQGYYLSMPLLSEEATKFLKEKSKQYQAN